MAGCGPEFLAAATPEDRALYRGIAEKAADLRVIERDALAREIRNEMASLENSRPKTR